MTKVYVLVCGDRITKQEQLVPIIDALSASHGKSGKGIVNCLVIAPHFEGTGALFFQANKQRGMLCPVLVRMPMNSEYTKGIMQDIAIKTGGKFFYSDDGIPLPTESAKADINDFGFADRVIVTAEETSIVGGNGDKAKVDERVAMLRTLQKGAEDPFDKEHFSERIGRLTGGIGIVRVSAKTETQTEELRYRVEDALCAAKSALSEGTVPGGGVALLRASQFVLIGEDKLSPINDDEQAGMQIVLAAISKPAWQIATNAGEKGDVIVHQILHKGEEEDNVNIGYNLTNRKYEDLRVAGIIDPKKAIRCSLENAVGVASTYLTHGGCVITESDPELPGKLR